MTDHGRNALELPPEEAAAEIRRQRGLPEYDGELSTEDRAEAVLWWLGAFREAVEERDEAEQQRLLNWMRFAEKLQTRLINDLEET